MKNLPIKVQILLVGLVIALLFTALHGIIAPGSGDLLKADILHSSYVLPHGGNEPIH